MKRNIIIGLVLIGVIFCTYWELWNTFYQQDEWASLGLALSGGPSAVVKDYSFVELAAGKVRVLGTLLNNVILLNFPFEVLPFVVFALCIHWINSVLVYILAYQLTKLRIVSLFAALYFAVASVSSGAVTWISAHATALTNGTFVLISLISYVAYLKTNSSRLRTVSFAAASVAFLFKESSIFIFLLLPFLSVILGKKRWNIRQVLGDHRVLLMYVIFIIIVRIVGLLGAEGQQGVFITKTSNPIERFVAASLFYPTISLSQMYIPVEFMSKIVVLFRPWSSSATPIQMSDLFSTIASLMLIFLSLAVAYMSSQFRRVIIFCLAYCVLSFLPFIVLERPLSSYLESRYYYLGIVGAAILFGVLLEYVYEKFAKTRFALLVTFCLSVFGVMILYKNSVYIRREVTRLAITATERKQFLTDLKTLHPHILDKPIFYIRGDSPGFYGIPDLAVPFQQGVGYTIMVLYFDSGKIPKPLFDDMFLWNINAQGYREIQNSGFGYFWDIDSLKDEFRRNPRLTQLQVIALEYVAGEKRLVDITPEIREELIRD